MINVREYVYWILDFLKGSRIRKHYNEIQFVIENSNHPNSIKIQERRLNELLNHATSTTPFYKKFTHKTIYDFPIINKSQILDDFKKFKSSTFSNQNLKNVSTSGSTGIPFKINQNSNKVNRNTADTIYFSSQANYKIGQKLIYIKLWDKKNRKNKSQLFYQNIIPFNILKKSNYEIKKLLEKINKTNGIKTIMIFPSFLESICKYLDKYHDGSFYNINSIITISESLNNYEKNSAAKHFKCQVFERYSNIENGILAQQTHNSETNYKINTASYFIEVLKIDSNEPSENGEAGRIVITDLFNYGMPLIRYDTGDLAILERNKRASFLKIYGRKIDVIYNTNGEVISPHIFYEISNFSDHKQYQFIQNRKKEYSFKLNSTKEKTDEKGLINHFKKYLGEDALFNFIYVNEIPLLSSGKRKKVVNNYIKNK